MYDVLVIGAGPSGLFSAIQAVIHGEYLGEALSVCILEKKRKPARKLLLSGSGKCNITHTGETASFLSRYGKNGNFLRSALYSFSNQDLIGFLKKRGLNVTELENGKIFPESQKAADILDLLLRECGVKQIPLICAEPVVGITAESGAFSVQTALARYSCTAVILAAGGSSYPATGSEGDGFVWAEHLGHTVLQPKPALTSVLLRKNPFSSCAGIALRDVKVALFRREKKIAEGTGDVLFTHKGLSGPAILDLSRYIESGDELRLKLVQYRGADQFLRDLMEEIAGSGKKKLKNCLMKYMVPERLMDTVLRQEGINPEMKAAELDKISRRKIINAFFALSCPVDSLEGFEKAMTTSGGVSVREIDNTTMGSKIVSGLFFAGEILDLDGDTGGYNLQMAFSTGAAAGRGAAWYVLRRT